jgi:hypothetical protein
VSAPVTLALVLAVAIPVQLLRAYSPPADLVDRWVAERGLDLTPENRPMVTRYLRSARVLRTWGAVAGAILPTLIELAWNGRFQVLGFGADGESAPLGFGTIFVGYLLGALIAEVSLVRRADGARRAASLVRRELEHYLPRWVIVAQRVLAAVLALGLLAIGLVPYPDSVSNPGPASLTLGAVAVLAAGAGLEAVERWLLRRPQPYTSPPLVAADDAIRAQSIRAVAGAGVALLLLLASGVSLGLQASDVTVLHWAMVPPAAVCLLLSLVACGEIGQRPWRVRRPVHGTGTAPT